MIIDIGIVAGEIWHYLDEHGEVGFSEVVKGIGRPRDLALMSVGGLGREGHVVITPEGKDMRVVLRKPST